MLPRLSKGRNSRHINSKTNVFIPGMKLAKDDREKATYQEITLSRSVVLSWCVKEVSKNERVSHVMHITIMIELGGQK